MSCGPSSSKEGWLHVPCDHWNWDNWEACLKACSRATRLCHCRCAQWKYIFYFFFFSSKHCKCWEEDDRKAASELGLGLGSFADVKGKERGCGQSWSRDLQG